MMCGCVGAGVVGDQVMSAILVHRTSQLYRIFA